MPVSFNSPPRNFFLLGSGGEDAVTNFFHNINKSSLTDGQYSVSDIAYTDVDQQFLLSGSGKDSNTTSFGWLEKRNYDPSGPSASNWSAGTVKFQSSVSGTNTTLNFMKQTLSYSGDIIVGGKTGGIPWIAQYNSSGLQQWISTSNSGDVEYTSVACKSSNYYACGYSNPTGQDEAAFIEKFDASGNPTWGKSSTRIGGNVKLKSIAANDRGEVVAVGEIDGQQTVGYVVKLDTTTGNILWDLTIDSGEIFSTGLRNPVTLNSVYIDGNDQIYIIGQELSTEGGIHSDGFIFKYTAEGNVIWQKKSAAGEQHIYSEIWSDTEVEQTIVLSHETVAGSPIKKGPTLIKYSKNGDVVFKRRIQSSTNTSQVKYGLDGDPSFYYVLFVDEDENVGTGASKTYNFGKVSASGNGFGAFTYDATNSKTISYDISSSSDRIGRLSDGSVRNDTSDHMSYPYSGLKTLFDDYATNIAYKKTRHPEKDVFLYSGSPAIRPADFQEMNLGTETTSTTITTSGGDPQGQQEYTTPGNYSWTAPSGVTSVSVVAIGGGGGGYDVTGGGGGGLGYKNNITVVPGQSYTVVVGDKGIQSAYADSEGEDSYFIDATTVKGGGGIGGGNYPGGGFSSPSVGDGSGGDYVGDGGGNGGDGGSGGGGSGGGGAGGYSGDGGDGGEADANGSNGSGGGGGGGGGGSSQSYPNYAIGGSGGGVGILGEGTSGLAGTYIQGSSTGGTGGSGGNDGKDGGAAGSCDTTVGSTDGLYGGGGASGNNGNCAKRGAPGVVRIIWGTGRSFPSTLTADQSSSSGPTTTTITKVVDQSGKGNDGVVDGATLNAAGYWEFDNAGDNIEIGTLGYDYSQLITLEAWIKTTDTDTWNQIVCGEAGDILWAVNQGKLNFGSQTNTPIPHNNQSTASINTGNWVHVLTTFDGANIKHYINGELDSTFAETGSLNANEGTHPLRIGARGTGTGEFYGGDIGEVRIYPRALTPAQVFQNYNATQYKYTNVRPSTSPLLSPSNIVIDNNLLLNYDFGNGACIEKSSLVSLPTYETIIDDATTNGAAYGDTECVAVGYDKVVVGARGETNGVYTGGGKAYIYNSVTGALEVTLSPSDISGNDWNFGNSVDICNCSGRIAVTSNSALYLYDADGTNEVIVDSSTTLPITPPGGNTFGNSVAISGNRVWVSDDNVPTGPNYSGTVYCFNAETGAFLYELRPKNTFNNFTNYGTRIVAGDRKLAIGADSITHPVTGRASTGRVYLYDVDGRNEKILEPDTLTTSSLFGAGGLAIDYGMLVVGASRQQRTEDPLKIGSGEVYVFDMNGDLKFSIRPSDDPANEDLDSMGFGSSVAISIDRIIVGAPSYTGNPGGVAGRAYQFTHTGNETQSWIGTGGLDSSGDASNFGSSMDAVSGTLVIGASSGSPDSSGRAYIYPLTNTPSGTIKNLSSSSYPGTINGPTFNSDGYWEFDGTDDSITVDAVLTQGTELSMEAWFNTNTLTSTQYIVDQTVPDGQQTGAMIRVLSNGQKLSSFFYYDAGFGLSVDSTAISANTWHHVVVTISASANELRMYIDGVIEDENTSATFSTIRTPPAGSTFAIGSEYDLSGEFFDGEIGEVRIYDTTLSATEVSQNFNATRGKYGV